MTEANDWNTNVINEFRENSGAVGGVFTGKPMVLLHTTGAKTGRSRVTPLVYYTEGDRVYVFASKGGAPENPDWYYNLVANPAIEVEVGSEKFAGTAVVLEGAERDEIFTKQAALQPQFAEYQSKTARSIPVVELRRNS